MTALSVAAMPVARSGKPAPVAVVMRLATDAVGTLAGRWWLAIAVARGVIVFGASFNGLDNHLFAVHALFVHRGFVC